jgi:hypothetical protein
MVHYLRRGALITPLQQQALGFGVAGVCGVFRPAHESRKPLVRGFMAGLAGGPVPSIRLERIGLCGQA